MHVCTIGHNSAVAYCVDMLKDRNATRLVFIIYFFRIIRVIISAYGMMVWYYGITQYATRGSRDDRHKLSTRRL